MLRLACAVPFLATVAAAQTTLCAPCHPKIAADYAQTGMGRSFYRPAALPDPPRDYYHDSSDTHFSVTQRDGRYYQRRWQLDPAGRETNVEELSVDYVMGSGNHARTLLHRTARGTLIELPLGWYAEPPHWAMSPGSDSPQPRTRRFISYKCMFCHNGAPQIPAANDTPIYTGELPHGIDCQRCHGPGAEHISATTPAARRAAIVNPARLDPARRMEICMSCHLETSSGRIPANIVRFDRAPFSFRPGEPLADFQLAFDHAAGTGHDAKFEAVSSVYRLRQSACFLRSEGRLTCDNCHDPHRAPRGAEAAAHYDKACRQCHPTLAATHTAAPDCAGCHMPKRRAEDTPGMIMTDHLIQRRAPANLTAPFRERPPEEYRGPVVPYYPATPDSLYLAIAQVGNRNNTAAGLPDLARELAARKPAEPEFYIVLGDAAADARQSVEAYRRAAELAPKSARPLRLLADALASAGQPAQAADAFTQAAALDPADPLTWHRHGLFDLAAGNFTAAAAKLRRAIALDPTLPDQQRDLGEVLAKAREHDAALVALRDALRTDPYDPAAHDLAGRVFIEKADHAAAWRHFETALRLRPGHPTYLYDYALGLARAGRFDDAESRALAALQANPNLAPAHELMGGLYSRNGRFPDAARAYRRLLELRPDARAHLRLGSALAELGDVRGATPHLREAARSTDPVTAGLAADALRRLGVPR